MCLSQPVTGSLSEDRFSEKKLSNLAGSGGKQLAKASLGCSWFSQCVRIACVLTAELTGLGKGQRFERFQACSRFPGLVYPRGAARRSGPRTVPRAMRGHGVSRYSRTIGKGRAPVLSASAELSKKTVLQPLKASRLKSHVKWSGRGALSKC